VLVVALGWPAGIQAQGQLTSQSCLECHGAAGEAATAGPRSSPTTLFVGDWQKSVHAGLECIDCHADITAIPHAESLSRPQCVACHAEVTERYERSVHAARVASGDSLAPRCVSCHDPHTVRSSSDVASTLHRSHVVQVCIHCHADNADVAARPTAVPHPVLSYTQGAHQKAMAAGNLKAATCGDCHDAHGVRRAADPDSPIFRTHVPSTCGRCHTEELAAYTSSVHGQGVTRGVTASPVCNTCHGEHAVARLAESGATTVVASETCESCHDNPALARRYDLARTAVSTYEDSYHGRAARGGLARAAGCTSCHGTHRILPKNDPLSSIHPTNLTATCSQCHPGATTAFAQSYAHAPGRVTTSDRATATVRRIYLWLIGLVIGGMILHNAVVWQRDLRREFTSHTARAVHRRLSRGEVRQHGALLVVFSLLVVTGFALRYPDALWARGLAALGLDEPARRILHRIAAVGFIAIGLVHLGYLFTGRGREQLRYLRPQARDVREAIDNMLHQLGRRASAPRFGRFRYIEKAEYWALVWGTAVMVVTGLVLWFPDRISGPNWLVRVSEAIHLYEAWLAFLAIVVWHLFFVLFRPGLHGAFTAITGKMDLDELAEEHPEEYAQLYGGPADRGLVAVEPAAQAATAAVAAPGRDPTLPPPAPGPSADR
jgi:cytochrome b subunit of formate dehydrogenase